MALFRFWTSTQPQREGDAPQSHPAFRLGTRLAEGVTRLEHQLANRLNQEQHRIGFRWRNVLLALVGAFFLLYFIALLTQ
ncbi:hypothetical protein GGR92_004981 [Spirosoma lacussanchae]|uniref:hypothetical protein n=1 Tax=Spirosoma lacussanchae TaxID=1884249 RepID=UPI0011094D3F|nr:hypothetical protein [Spirosoma lacussanchae]